jgi:MoxR-like ATPase
MKNNMAPVITQLNNRFIARNREIEIAILALLSKEHYCVVGPPGTAKSQLITELGRLIGLNTFSWLIHKTTTLEELLGPISLSGLESDKYFRITTGKLPESEIAFIDEIWNATIILPALNSILNERIFYNDGIPIHCPLISCYSASNQLPNKNESELLGTFDRFVFRSIVDYTKDSNDFRRLVELPEFPPSQPIMSKSDLEEIDKDIQTIQVSNLVLDQLVELWNKLRFEGIIVSDRRWRKVLKILKCKAYLEECESVDSDHFEILTYVLWQEPEQIEVINKIILSMVSPIRQTLIEYLDICNELENNCSDLASTLEANKGIKDILAKIEALTPMTPKDSDLIAKYKEDITTIHKRIVDRALQGGL